MNNKNNLILPIAIVIAGALIAISLFIVKRGNNNSPTTQTAAHPEDTMPPVTSADHILGNPDAPVIIVEYSDTDCPYCQAFQPTLQKIMDDYGKQGQVAWVYRHLAFHPNAPKEAEASECVAELGGNDKFWQFINLLFSKKDFTQTPYVGVDPNQLPALAGSIGVDQSAFSTCLNSGKYEQKVSTEYNDAIAAGAQGTPFTVLVTKTGRIPITTGAVPYATLKTAIDALLKG